MIANTAKWLIGTFVNDPSGPGWRRSVDDDRQPERGITLLVYSALGRACAVAHVSVPDSIRAAALDVQSGLRFRGYESADPRHPLRRAHGRRQRRADDPKSRLRE